MDKNLYIDFHVLQTVPPSCVNRDDTGSPKTAVYGGVTRARVSSQSWKHAMRKRFLEIFSEEQVGKRTKYAVQMIAEEIRALGKTEKVEKMAETALANAGIKIKNAEKGLDVLLFMSKEQARELARLIAEGNENKKEYKDALAKAPSVDMVLFGRMVAADPSLNYDAAAQVAHAISTHRIQNEYDYFTAVDDCKEEESAGAGHLGDVEFNSATLYRYATVNVKEVAKHLGKDTPAVIRGFADAFLYSMPEGRQNTFANRTVPDDVYVAIRTDQPVNLSGAFEKAVFEKEGYVAESEQYFLSYAKQVYHDYVEEPVAAFATGSAMQGMAPVMPLKELLDKLEGWVKEQLSDCEVV